MQKEVVFIEAVKQLAADGFGQFILSYKALQEECIAIKTEDPLACSDEAQKRGLFNRNLYFSGKSSIVCWPTIKTELNSHTSASSF